MLIAALVMVPVALADDDDDDGGGGGGPTPVTMQDVCTAASLPPPANLVVNGDFENPPAPPGGFTTYLVGTGPTGWTVTQNTVDQVHQGYWEAACGMHSIDLTGSPGQGTLTQNVAGTVAGQQYRLMFAYAANPDAGCDALNEPTTVTADVRWGGATVTTLSVTRTSDSMPPRTPSWQLFEATVVGQAGSTLLEFDSSSGTFCGVVIDAVSVTQIADGDDDDDDDGDDDEDDDDDDDDDDGNDDG